MLREFVGKERGGLGKDGGGGVLGEECILLLKSEVRGQRKMNNIFDTPLAKQWTWLLIRWSRKCSTQFQVVAMLQRIVKGKALISADVEYFA